MDGIWRSEDTFLLHWSSMNRTMALQLPTYPGVNLQCSWADFTCYYWRKCNLPGHCGVSPDALCFIIQGHGKHTEYFHLLLMVTRRSWGSGCAACIEAPSPQRQTEVMHRELPKLISHPKPYTSQMHTRSCRMRLENVGARGSKVCKGKDGEMLLCSLGSPQCPACRMELM